MPLDARLRAKQNPAMTDPDGPQRKAEILPFREPAKPKRADSVRPASGDEEIPEPLSNGALVRIGLLILFLVVAGVWLMNTLRDMGRLEDCAMQGRRNCVTIPVPDRNR